VFLFAGALSGLIGYEAHEVEHVFNECALDLEVERAVACHGGRHVDFE